MLNICAKCYSKTQQRLSNINMLGIFIVFSFEQAIKGCKGSCKYKYEVLKSIWILFEKWKWKGVNIILLYKQWYHYAYGFYIYT